MSDPVLRPAAGSERAADDYLLDFSPWSFWRRADRDQQQYQLSVQDALVRQRGATLGDHCFVSELAAVDTERLDLGDRSYIAAHAYVTGEVRMGRDCTINPFTVVRGSVQMGDAVRVGAHTSIIGFNHTFSDPDVEVFRQPTSSRGVTIGGDVWIGSHVVVLDGVEIGDKAVLGAGAVVTKDVPAGAVVAGNPARVVRWRVPRAGGSAQPGRDLGALVTRFAGRVRDEVGAVLERCWRPDLVDGLFVDRPNAAPTVRAQCDAVEIADLLLGGAPPQRPVEEQAALLRDWQCRDTGLVPELDADGRPAAAAEWGAGDVAYHALCVGYALDLLGSGFAVPVAPIADLSPGQLITDLDALPWHDRAWTAGSRVDAVGTVLLWHQRLDVAGTDGVAEALFGWLLSRADPRTGMWGSTEGPGGLLQVVNGCYRASRGTFAQFGLPVPYPERVVDTVLGHVGNPALFAPERQNACNVLDVAHPLWLAGRQTDHRRTEVVAAAERLLADAVSHWTPGRGFGFHAPHPSAPDLPAAVPGLQGTEMWLAVCWLLADLSGLSDLLGYRPRGIHRPEPASRLGA